MGAAHVVTHPAGDVRIAGAEVLGGAAGRSQGVSGPPAHVAVRIMLLHYLLQADGTRPAGEWVAFRELPDGLFYATSFVARAEAPLEAAFGGSAAAGGLDAFRSAAVAAGGEPFAAADVAFAFEALPLLRLGVMLWEGDDEFPARAQIVFDASAGHCLPAEDLAGLGGLLARRLVTHPG